MGLVIELVRLVVLVSVLVMCLLNVMMFLLVKLLFSDSIGVLWMIGVKLLVVLLLMCCVGELGVMSLGWLVLSCCSLWNSWLYLVLGRFGWLSM